MTGQLTSRLTNDLRQALSPVAIIMNTFVANIAARAELETAVFLLKISS